MVFRKGHYIQEVIDVLLACQAKAVYFNRQLEPWYRERDLHLESQLRDLGFVAKSFKALVLQREPWELANPRPPPHMLTKYQGDPDEPRDAAKDNDSSMHDRPAGVGWTYKDQAIEEPLPAITQLCNHRANLVPLVQSLHLAELGC